MTDVVVETKKRKVSSFFSGDVGSLNVENDAKKDFTSISDENGMVTLLWKTSQNGIKILPNL